MEHRMAEPNTDRDPLEVLAAEYMDRLRSGERLSIDDYVARHPELAGDIRELFPAIAVTERLKARQERSSGGQATLGAAQLERLGDFRIIREIGRGGMGIVFEAEQESLRRRVAVKVLPRQALLDEKHLKRFQREAQIAASLHHTNIVEVFGVGEQGGFHYYVMQFIEGVGLDAIIPRLSQSVRQGDGLEAQASTKSSTAADPEDALTEAALVQLLGQEGQSAGRLGPAYWRSVAGVGLQAADALSYAHGQGVLHRDIKPANLLLSGQGRVWLADFGLAKAARSEELSLSKDVVGTVRYMPPEQFNGRTDHRSDIYSLGLTLYELLVLRPAYAEADQSRLIQSIVQGPPTPPGTIRPGIPGDLETVILKAISHSPGERYQSAAELADDLRNFLDDRPIMARRATPFERLNRWCRRNQPVAFLAGTILLLLVLVASVATVGYVRTKLALQGEAMERAKAEANAHLAMEVVDRTFERLVPARTAIRPTPTAAGVPGGYIDVPVAPILTKETAALLEDMLAFYDRLAQQTGNSQDLRFRTAEANRRVGAIRQRLGQHGEAVKAYQQAIILYGRLGPRLSTNSDSVLSIAQIHNELGRIFSSQRQAEDARRAHLSALERLENQASKPSAPSALRFELARTYYYLGLPERPLPTLVSRERVGPRTFPSAQRDRLNLAVRELRALSGVSPTNPEYQHLLALCYLEGAALGDDRQHQPGGGNERAIEILQDIVKAYPGIADYAYDLSEAYARIQIPQPPLPREVEDAIEQRFNGALALLERLVIQHPDVPDFLASEARILHKLGSFHRQMERWDDAERCFRQATDLQVRLANQFPDAPYYSLWLATFRIALAEALTRRDQLREARVELEKTVDELQRELKKRPDTSGLHDLLSIAYAQLEKASGQTEQGRNRLPPPR
jgi:eukaryotic-like serine/threonine-protein kinase